jgi:glutamate synthase domain-containing protein 1
MPHEIGDRFKDECGVFGVFIKEPENENDAARTAFYGLYALQHRGQESAGIAVSDDIEKEALRELLEETGFTGRITGISPPLKSNPAFLNDYVYIVKAEIDETASCNLKPVQNLGTGEEIEVLPVKEKELPSFLQEQHKGGLEIGIGPWYVFCSL